MSWAHDDSNIFEENIYLQYIQIHFNHANYFSENFKIKVVYIHNINKHFNNIFKITKVS